MDDRFTLTDLLWWVALFTLGCCFIGVGYLWQ